MPDFKFGQVPDFTVWTSIFVSKSRSANLTIHSLLLLKRYLFWSSSISCDINRAWHCTHNHKCHHQIHHHQKNGTPLFVETKHGVPVWLPKLIVFLISRNKSTSKRSIFTVSWRPRHLLLAEVYEPQGTELEAGACPRSWTWVDRQKVRSLPVHPDKLVKKRRVFLWRISKCSQLSPVHPNILVR